MLMISQACAAFPLGGGWRRLHSLVKVKADGGEKGGFLAFCFFYKKLRKSYKRKGDAKLLLFSQRAISILLGCSFIHFAICFLSDWLAT